MTYKNGDQVPGIGFGTFKISDDDDVVGIVRQAIKTGYRLIDTAKIYQNETQVGQAIRESGIERDELFVTTKLWKADMGYDSALQAYDESLERLELGYADLYLIHWPIGATARAESWKAMVQLQEDGRIPHIGVSNFSVDHLQELKTVSSVTPEVNQIELHPYVWEEQKDIVEYCRQNGILVQAYSPLLRGGALEDETVGAIAEKHNKTPAQVLLRWTIQHDAIPLPKTTSADRMQENLAVFDFELDEVDMQSLDSLTNGQRFAEDPHNIP